MPALSAGQRDSGAVGRRLTTYDARRSLGAMKPRVQLPGGALEYAVLVALFDLAPASAREVHARVGAPQGLVYTTIAKVLDRLLAKGLVRRRPQGRAFVYEPAVARSALERSRAREALVRLLGDAPIPAIATLVDAVEAIDADLLSALAREVAARRRQRRGS